MDFLRNKNINNKILNGDRDILLLKLGDRELLGRDGINERAEQDHAQVRQEVDRE